MSQDTKQENKKVIAEAVREALKTIESEKLDAKRLLAYDAEKAVQVIETKKEADKDSGSIQNIMYRQVSLILSICGVVIGCFIFLTSPGTKNDTALQLQDQRINSQQTIIDTITKTQQNDTQEVKGNVATLTEKIEAQSVEIAKLTTIINERIPAKK